MSCNYAENLSPYENKGKLGLPEIFDSDDEVQLKCQKLAYLLKHSDHTVVHTGAGVSTAAGIPDFRGPNGVWTLEKQGKTPDFSVSWNDAAPTRTHMALVALQKAGYISCIITQNIDGLHLRSGIPRSCLAELHGNMFVDKCCTCKRQFVRPEAVKTVGQKPQGTVCPGYKKNGRRCRGRLYDTILDWEDALPDSELDFAHKHSCAASLSLCLGTTLQIVPSGNLPVETKKRGGKLVICNLQPTKQDRHADLIIHSYVDRILSEVLRILEIPLLEYDRGEDPVCIASNLLFKLRHPYTLNGMETADWPPDYKPVNWTISDECLNNVYLVEKSKKKVIKKKNSNQLKEKQIDC